MKVYVANFGSSNWAWRECLERNIIATMDDVRVGEFWQRKDLEGYVRECLRLIKNRHGKPLVRGTVTHWYNQITWLHESNGDLWLHSDTERLWWTLSLPALATSEERNEPDPSFGSQRINFYCKPCQPWSSKDKQGRELLWAALHPRAKGFLTNQGTFQPVLNQNAEYVKALVEGAELRRERGFAPASRDRNSAANSGLGAPSLPVDETRHGEWSLFPKRCASPEAKSRPRRVRRRWPWQH